MARWDKIFSLPVQSPPTLEFSSADLEWSIVEGWCDNKDRVARIPFARLDDFVRGESSKEDCPTMFHVATRRRRSPELPHKPKVDGILEYILYWCSFGPDDHRKGGIVRPSRKTYVPKKKNAGRPNRKRGCTCHFIVKRLIAEPSIALIIYNDDKHVDMKGLPCHGPQDQKAVGTCAMFAPNFSEDLRLRVLSLLYVGVSVETIMQINKESVERKGGPSNRDDELSHRYVRILERSIRRSTYELNADDASSVSMWVERHRSHVFFYEDFSDSDESDPFALGIQTDWQLQQMIRFGNCSLVASDSRFGTKKLKYPVHSLLVFNPDNKAIPVAWIITSGFASEDAYRWMRALYNRVRAKDPNWKLAGFIVDDPSTDVHTIRDVFQCPILVSFWRVRHAWHKNLMKRCSESEMRVEISKRLGESVDKICRGSGSMDLFEDFMEDFVDAADFMDYFKATWYRRIGMWISALKALPLASQETCAAMEFYHNQLKHRLLNEKNSGVYERMDWLADKLGTKVHSYFWFDEYPGKKDFARYWKDEWVSGLTCCCKASMIPDSDVVLESRCAKVPDQVDRKITHVVLNPGSEYGICDCNWAKMGNLCEHVFKVIRVCRSKGVSTPSISLFQYNMTLTKMLRCPPSDSLTRDHALSLAVSVQKQLDALGDSKSGKTSGNLAQQEVVKQQGSGENYVKKDREAFNEIIPSSNGKTPQNEDSNRAGQEASGNIHGNMSRSVMDLSATRNGVFDGSLGKETPCVDMDIDPLAICASPAGLVSVDEVISGDVFSQKVKNVLTSVNHKISENQLCEETFSKQNTFDHDVDSENYHASMMDLDPVSIPGSLEQCTWTNQSDAQPMIMSQTPDTDIPSGQSCASISLPSSSQVDTEAEAPYIEEDERMEVKKEDNSSLKLPPKNASVLDGNPASLTNPSDLAHDAKLGRSVKKVHPYSSPNYSFTFARKQHDATVENCVGDELSLISGSTINICNRLGKDDEHFVSSSNGIGKLKAVNGSGRCLPNRDIKHYYTRRKNRK